METSERYLSTIESLIVENCKLKAELKQATKGILPSNVLTEEVAEQCLAKISDVLGHTAHPVSLLKEVDSICTAFKKLIDKAEKLNLSNETYEKEFKLVELATKGTDIKEKDLPKIVSDIIRLHGVLEVVGTRLGRMDKNQELINLKKDIDDFLNGSK